jgi:CheY-like chemotaxis protein
MPSILMIENDTSLRCYFRDVLEREGYLVQEAADGVAGVKAYQDAAPDLVLCDLFLPEMDGLDVLKELRCFDPSVKIVAMSGGGGLVKGDHLSMALAFGALAVLAKPFGYSTLMEAVRSALAA